MATKRKTYLKTGRKKIGLTQRDIAALLHTTPDRMSRIEAGNVLPTLEEVLILEVLYETHSDLLMGSYTKEVYADLTTRVRDRYTKLLATPDAYDVERRLRVLSELLRLLA